MMHQPLPTLRLRALNVAMLSPQRRKNRKQRRAGTHGKQHRWDKLRGRLSPKQVREAGLDTD